MRNLTEQQKLDLLKTMDHSTTEYQELLMELVDKGYTFDKSYFDFEEKRTYDAHLVHLTAEDLIADGVDPHDFESLKVLYKDIEFDFNISEEDFLEKVSHEMVSVKHQLES